MYFHSSYYHESIKSKFDEDFVVFLCNVQLKSQTPTSSLDSFQHIRLHNPDSASDGRRVKTFSGQSTSDMSERLKIVKRSEINEAALESTGPAGSSVSDDHRDEL